MVKVSNLKIPLLSNSGPAVKLLLKSPIPLCLRANSWKDRAAKEFTARENVSSPSRNNTFMVLMKLRFSAKRARGSPFWGMMTSCPNWPMNWSKVCGPVDLMFVFQFIFGEYFPYKPDISMAVIIVCCCCVC